MKRKMSFILALLMIVSLITGCTGNQASLFTELSSFAAWNAASVDITGKTSLSIDKLMKFGVLVEADEQFNKAEGQYYVDMNVKLSGEDNLWEYSDFNASFKIPKIKIYLDKEKLYVNKELILGIYEIFGNTPDEFANLKKDFVSVSLSEVYDEAIQAQSSIDFVKYVEVFNNFSSSINVQKSGRTYTIELNSDELVNLLVDFAKYYNENMDKFEYIFGTTHMELPSEEEIKEMKEIIDGSRFEYKCTFSSNKVIMDLNCNIKTNPIYDGDVYSETAISLNTVYNKTDDVKINMPTSNIEFTFEELDNIINPKIEEDYDIYEEYDPYEYSDTAIINLADKTLSNYSKTISNKTINIINKDGITYLPLRPVLEAMKCTVNYDSTNKKIYYKDYYDDVAIEIESTDFIIINGASYINIEKLIENGFTIYYRNNNNIQEWRIFK